LTTQLQNQHCRRNPLDSTQPVHPAAGQFALPFEQQAQDQRSPLTHAGLAAGIKQKKKKNKQKTNTKKNKKKKKKKKTAQPPNRCDGLSDIFVRTAWSTALTAGPYHSSSTWQRGVPTHANVTISISHHRQTVFTSYAVNAGKHPFTGTAGQRRHSLPMAGTS